MSYLFFMFCVQAPFVFVFCKCAAQIKMVLGAKNQNFTTAYTNREPAVAWPIALRSIDDKLSKRSASNRGVDVQ